MNIVILAAGKGTRMKSDLPKVLHPVGGLPMLAHVIRTAAALAPKKIVVVIGHGAETVKKVFSDFSVDGLAVDIQWVLQDPPLGTGHAVQQAAGQLDPSVNTLVLYGDVPLLTANTLKRLQSCAQDHRGMAVLTAHLPDPFGYGRIVRDSHGSMRAVVEEKDADASTRQITEINTGTLILPTPALLTWLTLLENNNSQKEFYLTDVISLAVRAGQPIGAVQPEDNQEIMGINSQSQRAQAERAYQLRLANDAMAQGVAIMDPARFDVRGTLRCAAGVTIDVGCVFEGDVQIDAGAQIGPHCVIRNCHIAAAARIEAFSHLDQAMVGPGAVVGPYARLRPGTTLGEGAHVGNFVEIKNTVLGAGSKANHLSYLGDATIGRRVNIGAGTITCNYDGLNKYRTVIEDDAFIGSDSQLVAPVTVGKGATLAAGTTLTQDAPADQLTLSRTPQKSIARWKRPQKKAH
jgi:bifunctional UDP-N-acetylglucosamine pyrophosphorylase / glucosamine-1-phosphate N-acetyltransferase